MSRILSRRNIRMMVPFRKKQTVFLNSTGRYLAGSLIHTDVGHTTPWKLRALFPSLLFSSKVDLNHVQASPEPATTSTIPPKQWMITRLPLSLWYDVSASVRGMNGWTYPVGCSERYALSRGLLASSMTVAAVLHAKPMKLPSWSLQIVSPKT